MTDDAVRSVLARWSEQPRRAALFDFNGTLCDDEPILLEIFDEIFSERFGSGMTASEYYEDLAGLSDREIVQQVLSARGIEERDAVDGLLRERAARYRDKVAQRSPVRDGTVRLVEGLAEEGVSMGIVTGAQRPDVDFVLGSSPVGRHLPVIVTEEDVAHGKPDPEGYLLGARLLDRRPEEVLVLEDSVPGVQAALAAGMHCIAVAGKRPDGRLRGLAHCTVADLGVVATCLSA